jgi:hypothetical protein
MAVIFKTHDLAQPSPSRWATDHGRTNSLRLIGGQARGKSRLLGHSAGSSGWTVPTWLAGKCQPVIAMALYRPARC